ncbi:hypothetical protein ABT281_36780, partial [Streptomyces filamentosus]
PPGGGAPPRGPGGGPAPGSGWVSARAAVTAGVAEPAIADPGQLPLRPRPSLQAVRASSRSRTVDLTAEDDTQGLPLLDDLEAKISEMERKLG